MVDTVAVLPDCVYQNCRQTKKIISLCVTDIQPYITKSAPFLLIKVIIFLENFEILSNFSQGKNYWFHLLLHSHANYTTTECTPFLLYYNWHCFGLSLYCSDLLRPGPVTWSSADSSSLAFSYWWVYSIMVFLKSTNPSHGHMVISWQLQSGLLLLVSLIRYF